jgi:hypothetical protein
MQFPIAIGAAVGAVALALSGCSSTPSSPGVTEDVSRLGDTPAAVSLECSKKQVPLSLPEGIVAIKIEAVGAAGGGEPGSVGGSVVGSYDYQASDGSTLYAKVGCQGAQKGGFPDGGDGIATAQPYGGGGGSTGLYRNRTGGDATNPIVVAGGGGGASSDGTKGGSPLTETGVGGPGSGPKFSENQGTAASCGGGGGQIASAGLAVPYGSADGNPYPGKNGRAQRGGDAPAGDTPGGFGGAGGGGHYGGASGCTADIGCSGCYGSGGSGSSYADPTSNVTYATVSKPSDGSLGLTFLCSDKTGSAVSCVNQPTGPPSP